MGCFLLVECGGKLGIMVLEEEAEEAERALRQGGGEERMEGSGEESGEERVERNGLGRGRWHRRESEREEGA